MLTVRVEARADFAHRHFGAGPFPRGGWPHITARSLLAHSQCRKHNCGAARTTFMSAYRHSLGSIALTRTSMGAPSNRFGWGKAKGRSEGSGQMRRIGEARIHSGSPHQFTGSYLARGMLEC